MEQTSTLPIVVLKQCDEVQTVLDRYTLLKIHNQTTSIQGGYALKAVKEARRDLEALRKSLTAPLDDEKKQIMTEFYPRIRACDLIIERLSSELKTWSDSERKRQEDARRVEEERAKAEQEAERKRLAEEAKAAENEWDFLKAQKLEERSETVRVPALVIPERRTLIRGLTERKLYRFRIVNADLIPREFLIPDEKTLGDLARSTKGEATVPGVEFYSETTIAG